MKKCKVGLLGVGRGGMLWKYCKAAGNAEIVAVCDKWQEGLDRAKKDISDDNVAYYTDFNEFIKHDMDAVLLANYATEHAPFAIAAMKAGKHVLSEVLPALNMAQAVELIECVEETGMKYCYLENYCYMYGPREMKRRYQSGELGEFEYAEGEYMHNCEPIWHSITQGNPDHWRNNMSAFYYCTHSTGPIIHIAGLRPVKVVGIEMPFNTRMARMGAKAGNAALEIITFENGAIGKSLHGIGCSKDSIWYSVYGSKGRLETAREDAKLGDVSRVYENLDKLEGVSEKNIKSYEPTDEFTINASKHGHSGSDYICMYNAFEHINGNEADTIDVYEAIDMWMPGFFGYLSAIEGGITFDIPNLRNKEERDLYRNDFRCTEKKFAGDQLLPSYSKGNPQVDPKIYELCKEKWENSTKKVEAEPKPDPQLVMNWENDGEAAKGYTLPEGVTVERFCDRETALTDWLEIVSHGITHEVKSKDFYDRCMYGDYKYYNDDKCFFLIKDGEAAATITVICDPEKKQGYIHMVACKENFRGQGLGTLLNNVAVKVLKDEGMETAYLTTDDWRIPAIKSYLRCGFKPDLSTENFKERWDKIFEKINKK